MTVRNRISEVVTFFWNNNLQISSKYQFGRIAAEKQLIKEITEETYAYFKIVRNLDDFIEAIKHHFVYIYDEKNIKREDSLPLVEFTENNINDLKFPTVVHKFYFDLRDYQSQRHCLCIDHEGNMNLFEQIENINIAITKLEEIFNNYMNDKHLIMMIKRPIVRTLDELPKLRTFLLRLLETRSKLKM